MVDTTLADNYVAYLGCRYDAWNSTWNCVQTDGAYSYQMIWDMYQQDLSYWYDGWIPQGSMPVLEERGGGELYYNSWTCGIYWLRRVDPEPCSATNACGMTAPGWRPYGGSCSAIAPSMPAYYGASCSATSAVNACGQTNTNYGTYNCSQQCSATTPSAPALPANYGASCSVTSAPNACGQTNTNYGTYGCSNNCSANTPAAPSNASCPTPDVTAGGITPTSAVAGTPTTLYSTISNIGNGGTGSGFPNYFIIRNGPGSSGSDVLAQNPSVGALGPGTSGTISVSYTFPGAGTYSGVVCADYNGGWGSTIGESNEGNNCGPWTNITVAPAPVADLTAGATSVSSLIQAGSNISLSATVSNIGTATASNFPNIYQITDDGITYTVRMVDPGTRTLGPSTSTGIGATTSSLPEGWYRVRACANYNTGWGGSVSESNSGNNCGDWSRFQVRDSNRDVACSPANQTVSTSASWTASGGSGYTWRDALGNTLGSGSSLSQTYTSNGNYAVTVSSGSFTSTACNVRVTGAGSCSASPAGSLTADAGRVRQGTSTTLRWSAITGVHTSCSVTNTAATITPNENCDASASSVSSGPVTTQTTYVLRCDGIDLDSVTVDVLPVIQEF